MLLIRLNRICKRLSVASGSGKTAQYIVWFNGPLLYKDFISQAKGENMKQCFFAVVAGSVLLAAPVVAGDAAKGEKVFRRCKACHYMDKEKNKTGPHLVDVIGRAAGAVEGYNYSRAMSGSGLVWNEATIARFLTKPKKYLKGTKMAFAGLRKESDIADVIAYLKASE